MEMVDDVSKQRDHAFICKLISEYFSQKVLLTLTEIMDERKKAMLDAVIESDSDAEEENEGSSEME